MKATKKIVGATCALVAAVALSAGSTFAWFSANTNASATGMQVTAKSNALYLLVGDNANIATTGQNNDKNSITKSVAAVNSDATTTRYPVSYAESTVTGADSSTVAEGSWYTANSNDSSAVGSGSSLINVKEVTPGFGGTYDANYFVEYKVWLTLSKDSEATEAYKLKVTLSLDSGSDAATKAVVYFSDKSATNTLRLDASSDATKSATSANVVSLSSSTVVAVSIYVYLDGTSTNITSDYLNSHTSITGTANISFDLVT